jgi:glycosyl transferase, family 25
MELLKNILFINLEHRKDRLLSVTTQLQQMGLKGERLNAIKNKNGAIGCSLSHIKCLQIALKNEWEYVCIIEDDIVFTDKTRFFNSLNDFDNNFKEKWDVLILGGNNCPPFNKINENLIKVNNCQTTTGYIVNKNYYSTLISNFKDSVSNLMKEPTNKKQYALDIYWKKLQQLHNWYLLTPLTIHQLDDYSDIENRVTNYKDMMLDVDKAKYFRS